MKSYQFNSAVGGGASNHANGAQATVAVGSSNNATGFFASIGGGSDNRRLSAAPTDQLKKASEDSRSSACNINRWPIALTIE